MHEYFHAKFGVCLWDLGALAVLAVLVLIVVMLIVHVVRQKKRENNFEDELTAKMVEDIKK